MRLAELLTSAVKKGQSGEDKILVETRGRGYTVLKTDFISL